MFELNRGERRALWLATVIVLLGAAARLGLGPDEAAFSWSERPPPVDGAGASGSPAAESASEDGELASGLTPLADAHRTVQEGVERAARASVPLGPRERIDPNAAPAEELDRLPGVGPATARAILEERAMGGIFRSLADMLRVSGIGPSRLRRMAPHLSLPDGATVRDAGTHGGPGGPVDLNRADRTALERLPGIGPALADRILEARGRDGPFRAVEDLLTVPGIGPVTLRRLEGRVVIR